MATFYYNRYSGENINSQWIRHLQTNAYIKDIDGIVSQNRRELQAVMQNSSDIQKKAIQQVCGKLEEGFNEVNQHLKDINFNISELRGEINEMASMLDWKLSLVVEEQRLTNQFLGEITQLLRIPDIQKQRVYHIEQGFKYLKNAILEGVDSTFYVDAYESFKDAEKIERRDFITLNRIGQIHLYSKKHLNFSLAEEYLLKSAREAFAEANAGGTTASKHFKPNGHQQLIYSNNPFKTSTAEAYLYASRACYLQTKLVEAAELAGKAYNLVPEFLEAGFEQAKYLAANNQENEAAKILETIIEKDRYFSIKVLMDRDLTNKISVLNLLEKIKIKAIAQVVPFLNECKNIMKANSKAKEVVDEIEANIIKDNFLSGMKALDLLKVNYEFPYKQNTRQNEIIYRINITSSQKLIEFIRLEYNSDKLFEILKTEAKKEIISKRLVIYSLLGALIGIVILFIKGNNFEFIINPNFKILFGTLLGFPLLGALLAILGIGTRPDIRE